MLLLLGSSAKSLLNKKYRLWNPEYINDTVASGFRKSPSCSTSGGIRRDNQIRHSLTRESDKTTASKMTLLGNRCDASRRANKMMLLRRQSCGIRRDDHIWQPLTCESDKNTASKMTLLMSVELKIKFSVQVRANVWGRRRGKKLIYWEGMWWMWAWARWLRSQWNKRLLLQNFVPLLYIYRLRL